MVKLAAAARTQGLLALLRKLRKSEGEVRTCKKPGSY
jgi:hypothetical protein